MWNIWISTIPQATTPANTHVRASQANFDTAFLNISNKPANAPSSRTLGGADPFSRRETRPNISWSVFLKQATQAGIVKKGEI
jgi:hypothetical protein